MRSKRKTFLAVFIQAIFISLLIAGCGTANSNDDLSSPPDGEGFILETASNRVLVIDRPMKGKKWEDISPGYHGKAIWLRTNRSDLRPGQKIQYWVKGGVAESYPMQAQAETIKVMK
ncbi:MAG TPA: YobA family protein [Bacillales bacterium]|nr:YobA family protein [Bacillales bacterium]